MQSRRRSDAVLAGQGSHLADLRSSLASEKVRPRYPDEEAAFSAGPESPEPHHRRTDSGVAGLEGPQRESKRDVNGRSTGVTGRGTSGDAQPGRGVSMRDPSLGAQDQSPSSISGISPGQRGQVGPGKVGGSDEKEVAASAAASAYFGRKSDEPMETMRPGKAMHSLSKSKEAPMSAWGKGREYRPLAHDPLAGVPRRDSGTLGPDASSATAPSTAGKPAPQRTAQPVTRAAETGQMEQTEYKPEGYSGMTEARYYQGGYQKQYEEPISEGPELYPEAPTVERQYDEPISEGQAMRQGGPKYERQYESTGAEEQEMPQGAPIYERQYEQPIKNGQGVSPDVPTRERQQEIPINERPEIATEAPKQPTAVQPPQPPQAPYVSQPEHEFVTVEEIIAREEATRRAVMEEALARRKAAEEVASREAVTREAAARETIARETAQEEIAVMEAATREAYAKESLARESTVAELAALEEATRQAVAREEAAREAAIASIQSTEAATREAVAREALTKQTVAERIATREVVTREAIAREAAAREAANREAAIKQANTREVAAEEVAVREAALREGGFDEAIARDAALREVAAEETAALRAEEGFAPQEPGAREILVREPGPGSVAAGGVFAEEVAPEQIATVGVAQSIQPAGAGVSAAPMAEPIGQAPHTEEYLGAQAREEPRDQLQGGVAPEGRRPSKEEKELEKKRSKEEKNLEKQRTKEQKELEKQRSKQEKKLEKQRTREEKARQEQLKKEEKEVQKQQERANKQLKRSQKKQAKEAKRHESDRSVPETANQEQRGGGGLLGKIRRASRSMGLERPNGYGMERNVPNAIPTAQTGRA
ncbi:hypothetical protein AJ78_04050 [Emergomyces pasteurianus Ep9510]|uniref:Uncharacterized protein n=1 Tax=Emergomyces pasteurianus Ep9510 TaxID=1447872 RepID=A0A1J9Q667_9EURO|nr:hypothetical protein AJ78_04050 [Emergomyces pasteurianus Ep9510]